MLGYKTPTLSELQRMIVPNYAAKWKELGELLKLPVHSLDVIAIDNKNHPYFKQQCCMAVLEMWLKRTTVPTWSIMQKAIDDLPKSKEN